MIEFKCCGKPVEVLFDSPTMAVLQCTCGQKEVITEDYRWIEEPEEQEEGLVEYEL